MESHHFRLYAAKMAAYFVKGLFLLASVLAAHRAGVLYQLAKADGDYAAAYLRTIASLVLAVCSLLISPA